MNASTYIYIYMYIQDVKAFAIIDIRPFLLKEESYQEESNYISLVT